MTNWQYFYIVIGTARPGSEPFGLGRTDRDGEPYNAQTLGRGVRWVNSEYLLRYHLLGSNDNDYVEISEEGAIEIIRQWVASGRIARWPDEPKRPSA